MNETKPRRPCVSAKPPTKKSINFLKVKSWCIYTTTLEPILAKIAEAEQPRTPPCPAFGGAMPQQNFLLQFLFFARAHFLFSIKEEENFVSAFCSFRADGDFLPMFRSDSSDRTLGECPATALFHSATPKEKILLAFLVWRE